MINLHLHIVSFNIPFPANYGGVIDVFYKLKALKNLGVKITLHCFEYGRNHAEELNKFCENVFYYKRKNFLSGIFTSLPYIVNSRQSELLIQNLLKDNSPVIFEGLHTCFYLDDKRLKNHFKIYRESNIEHDYYSYLAKAEKNFFKKIYFKTEAERLRRFEKILSHADLILPVSTDDANYFQKNYSKVKTEYLPSFHQNDEVNILNGAGEYILYHGNLSVAENKEAVLFLLKNVFSKIETPCVIAGMNPDNELKNAIEKYKNIRLVENPDENEMKHLISNAQVNMLVTFQPTGLKLKLLNALFAGRHCLVNSVMLAGTELYDLCEIADNANEMVDKINVLTNKSFTQENIDRRKMILNIDRRKMILNEKYSNQKNAERLMKSIHY